MAVPKAHLFLQKSFFSVLLLCCFPCISGDVPDDVVYTDLHKTVRKGDSVVLTCRFLGTPLAVYWKKGDDPRTAPNLVSWIPTDNVTGLCEGVRPCQIMEMNENHSLIIKEVSIAEQGRYICRVSSYRRGLIHGFTDISVFSPPMEPFPIINECQMISTNDTKITCIIVTSHSVEISCSTSGYFPDIDLYFLHGSTSLHTKHTIEFTNLDRTKNKTIFAIASASEISYVCFASNIPGLQEQRTTTVLVNLPETPSPIRTGYTIPNDKTVKSGIKVVVPVIVILALICVCASIIFWCRRKPRSYQEKDDQESMLLHPDPQINGKVSFFELWCLVKNMDETNLTMLGKVLIDLGIHVVEKELTADKAYGLLCDWKDTNTFDKEGLRPKDTFIRHGLDRSWKEMCERRSDTESAVSEELLGHVLWSIDDETRIRVFIRELITEKPETRRNVPGNKGDVISKSMVGLREWRDRVHSGSQVSQLSLALERVKCKPLDRTFFKVPEHLMKAISPKEVEGFVYRLTGRHCKRLAKVVGITDEKKIETIMNENNEDLILIQSMVNDWVDGQECCNFEKRCMLDDATITIGRHDMTDSFGTTSYRVKAGGILERPHPNIKTFNSSSIFDDDLASLLKHLPAGATPLFLEKLGISVDEEGDDLEQKLQCWRDRNIKESKIHSLQGLVSIHSDTVKKTNDSKVHVLDVNDDELENVIASMASEKLLEEPTSRHGIKNDKEQSPLQRLKEWRKRCKMDERRKTLRKAFYAMKLSGCIVDRLPAKHVYQAELVRLAWTMFSIDICPLATLLDMDMNKEKSVGEQHMKGTVHLLNQLLEKSKDLDKHRRRDFCVAISNLGYLDVARSCYYGYDASLSELCNLTTGLSEDEIVKLAKHLVLEKDVLSVCQETTGAYDKVKLMTIWRDRLRPEPLYFRFKLAIGLRAVGRTKITSRIIAGEYHTTEVDSRIVESICNSLDDDQLRRLREYLRLKARDDQNLTTATLVTEWVRNWLTEFDEFSPKQLIKDKIVSRGKEMDNLFREGFVKLAEEVMLLEISKFRLVNPVNKEHEQTSSEDESEIKPANEKCLENTRDHGNISKNCINIGIDELD